MKHRTLFNRIFNNNKAVAILSVIAAAVIWLFVSIELVPETTVVVRDVPVSVNSESLDTLGLEGYGISEAKVNVTLRGKSYIVDAKDIKDSISVTADTSSVVDSGNYTLRLDAASKDNSSDIEIVSVEPSNITAYFDTPVTDKEFIIEPSVESSGEVVPDGYVAGDAIIDSASSKIKVSGPQKEVSNISKITAVVKLTDKLTQTGSFTVDYSVVTKDGSELKYVTFDRDSQVTVKIPVYKKASLATDVEFVNRPSDYIDEITFPYSVSPSKVSVGIGESKLEGLTSLIVGSVDFSKLNTGKNTFTFTADEVEKLNSCLILDDTEKFTVTVNVEGMSKKTLKITKALTTSSDNGEMSVGSIIPDFDTVTVIGPKEKIDLLTSDDLELYADMSNADADIVDESSTNSEKARFVTVPVIIGNNDSYWIYSADGYTANVEIKDE